MDNAQRIAHLIVQRIDEGHVDDGAGLEEIAADLELSSRQLRRIVQKELGVSPMELILTRRLLLAKQLLTETHLPVIDIAFASGFSSLRRFNAAFSSHYRMPPTRLRKEVEQHDGKISAAETSSLQLAYRPPFVFRKAAIASTKGAASGPHTPHSSIWNGFPWAFAKASMPARVHSL